MGKSNSNFKIEFKKRLYKLTLKYLKQKAYDIGNNKVPRVKNSNQWYAFKQEKYR